ncbi:unnamed protein product [Cylindrotheca closterium]|uniref:Bulb-type lectin domain-containing protein n=1 Tax=Cylindrotheca closterium TaxID=2856 RepID=A0AAD2CPC9_9STRA|nr:unnamed protein product [Cylindrotheca closterium]
MALNHGGTNSNDVGNIRKIQIPAAFQQSQPQPQPPPPPHQQNLNNSRSQQSSRVMRPTNHRYEESPRAGIDIEANSLSSPSRDQEMRSAVRRLSPYSSNQAPEQPEPQPQSQTMELVRENKVQTLAQMLLVSQDTALRALLETDWNMEQATARILEVGGGGQVNPPSAATANNTTNNTSRSSRNYHHTNNSRNVANTTTTPPPADKKKPDRLIIGLIIGFFVVGSITLGLLQWQHGEEINSQKKSKPRIFNDYFVGKFNGTVILKKAETLEPGEFASSPSGNYRVGLTLEGDLVLQQVVYEDKTPTIMINNETADIMVNNNETADMMQNNNETTTKSGVPDTTASDNAFETDTEDNTANDDEEERTILEITTIWSAGIQGSDVYMQTDGNLIIRKNGTSVWGSGTHKHDGATLIVDDGGRIGVRFMETLIWMQGLPQGFYQGPSSEDLVFPVRGAFYYPWYPQTWKVSSGDQARFEPDLGYYVSGDPNVVDSHIDQLEYGRFDLGIISWFGPGTNLDIARITNLMDRTLELNAKIKWAIYYEDEWKLDPNQELLKDDFEYIKKYFAWHPTYAHVDGGKPLIFVWNEGECEVVDRWMKASNDEWFVIPKLFGGYKDCPVQPNDWHQYGPASPYASFKGHSISISPGFWHAGEAQARLPRLSESEWCDNVRRMSESGEPWQLVTTFNEQGEGTSIESTAAHWPSQSGYGYYLDCLHFIP